MRAYFSSELACVYCEGHYRRVRVWQLYGWVYFFAHHCDFRGRSHRSVMWMNPGEGKLWEVGYEQTK